MHFLKFKNHPVMFTIDPWGYGIDSKRWKGASMYLKYFYKNNLIVSPDN